MKIKTTGFDKITNHLKKLSQRLEELDGTHTIPFDELFPDSFMTANTKFASIQEMLDKSGFEVATREDFAAIPDDDWDRYVRANTTFESWSAMQGSAVQAWTSKKMEV